EVRALVDDVAQDRVNGFIQGLVLRGSCGGLLVGRTGHSGQAERQDAHRQAASTNEPGHACSPSNNPGNPRGDPGEASRERERKEIGPPIPRQPDGLYFILPKAYKSFLSL